jgi:hypothetical protein
MKKGAVRKVSRPSRVIALGISMLVLCGGCGVVGLSVTQRADAITFGKSLSMYGELLSAETTLIRSQIKQMRVLAVSLPNPASSRLFGQGEFTRLGHGVDEERCEHIVQLGVATENFGNSIAKVADLTTSSVDEQRFQSTARNFVISVLHASQTVGGVPLGASAANLFTFVMTDAYRRRVITQTLIDSEPAVRSGSTYLAREFAPNDETSLLFLYNDASARLANLLESSQTAFEASALPANERQIVAEAHRVVIRNRSHIRYVTSHMAELSVEANTAYDNLVGALTGAEFNSSAIDSFSDQVFKTKLAFKTLS